MEDLQGHGSSSFIPQLLRQRTQQLRPGSYNLPVRPQAKAIYPIAGLVSAAIRDGRVGADASREFGTAYEWEWWFLCLSASPMIVAAPFRDRSQSTVRVGKERIRGLTLIFPLSLKYTM